MEPFYFGQTHAPMFGVFHPAAAEKDRSSAVLICHGLNHDYLRSHRQVNQVAQQLASAGFSTLRFDHPGNGDSWGASRETTTAQWLDGIAEAMDELQARSAAQSLNVLSLRAGALFVDNADLAEYDVSCHLSIDPVIDGADYHQRLEAAHRAMLVDPKRFGSRLNKHYVNPDFHELLGTEYAHEFIRDLAGMTTSPQSEGNIIGTENACVWKDYKVASRLKSNARWERAEILETQLVLPGLLEAAERFL